MKTREKHGKTKIGESIMKVMDLSENHEKLYCMCLEDWSDDIKEAGHHKETWYSKMKDKGLRVKLALDDRDNPGGMIQYLPIEYSFVAGENLYFILCIWVHGHKQGPGNFQGKGMGAALLEAAETDARERGAKGLVAWGISLPLFMRASWFKKHGYRPVDRMGLQVLLWKPFTDDAVPPRWIRPKKKPGKIPHQVTVTVFLNGWCPVQSLAYERAKRAAAPFGDKVVFKEINTFDRDTFLEWGISDGLYVDDKAIRTGPPPSFEKIRKKIARRVNRLKA